MIYAVITKGQEGTCMGPFEDKDEAMNLAKKQYLDGIYLYQVTVYEIEDINVKEIYSRMTAGW